MKAVTTTWICGRTIRLHHDRGRGRSEGVEAGQLNISRRGRRGKGRFRRSRGPGRIDARADGAWARRPASLGQTSHRYITSLERKRENGKIEAKLYENELGERRGTSLTDSCRVLSIFVAVTYVTSSCHVVQQRYVVMS